MPGKQKERELGRKPTCEWPRSAKLRGKEEKEAGDEDVRRD